eukprot:10556164-Alexandrium_andersonii.AAC.1
MPSRRAWEGRGVPPRAAAGRRVPTTSGGRRSPAHALARVLDVAVALLRPEVRASRLLPALVGAPVASSATVFR